MVLMLGGQKIQSSHARICLILLIWVVADDQFWSLRNGKPSIFFHRDTHVPIKMQRQTGLRNTELGITNKTEDISPKIGNHHGANISDHSFPTNKGTCLASSKSPSYKRWGVGGYSCNGGCGKKGQNFDPCALHTIWSPTNSCDFKKLSH